MLKSNFFFVLIFLSLQACAASPKKQTLVELHQAANYLQVVFDQQIENMSKPNSPENAAYCGIKQEEGSMYLQVVRARIDQVWMGLDEKGNLALLKELNAGFDNKCADNCSCDLWVDVNSKIAELAPAKRGGLKGNPQADKMLKQQNNTKCFVAQKSFCQSPLFQDIAKDYRENFGN